MVKGLPDFYNTPRMPLCNTCLKAKAKILPFDDDPPDVVFEPGDVIVSDMDGPAPISA
jgi:hypothetical protein